jgi:hypothetical protein
MVHEHLQRSVRCSEPDLQPFNGGHACTGHDAAPLTSWRRTAHSRARNSSRARTDGSRPRRDRTLHGRCHCGAAIAAGRGQDARSNRSGSCRKRSISPGAKRRIAKRRGASTRSVDAR